MEKHHDLPGSPAWHARRARCFNAGDAAAMLSCSPLKTRTQLLDELSTGIEREFSDYVQERVIDPGHAIEALCRPFAEDILDEELQVIGGSLPVAGLSRPLGASLDGVTFMEDTNWECKRLNDELRAALPHSGRDSHQRNDAKALPKDKRVQMEQQMMVDGAKRCLFTAGELGPNDTITDERHAWYDSDPALRAEILAGWRQFDADLATHVKKAAPVTVVASPVQALPAVSVIVSGEIEIRHNFDAFEVAARDFIEHRLIREPKTDQDFADLDLQIKAMKGAEAALDAAEDGWIAQIEPVSTAKRRKDMLGKLMRDNRLMAEKLLASEKERRRGEIVAGGVSAFAQHVAGLNKRLGKAYMPTLPADFGGAIKGKKSLASMEDAVASELARAKILANETADRIQANLSYLSEDVPQGHAFLFADLQTLVLKAPDDFRAVVDVRIAGHKEQKEREEAAQRERIRKEEVERIEHEQAAAAPPPSAPPVAASPAPAVIQMAPRAAAAPVAPPSTPPTLTLGQIGTRLGFNLTADFLKTLGFEPAGRQRGAVLFHEVQFPHICAALVEHVQAIQSKQAA
jgi:predicted phage-related endonuclease